jgi:enoyl-CoA hydratase
MTSELVSCQRRGASGNVALFTLQRPARANAYTAVMLEQFSEQYEDVRRDPAVVAAVLTAGGDAFCAGADLAELGARTAPDALSLLSRDVFERWARAPWPTIAALDGPAVAGGFEWALACDLRIASPRAFLRLPEVELGLIPAAGGIPRLVGQIGVQRTKELVLFGKTLDAATALSWGLLAEIHEDPVARALEVAQSLAGRDPMCLALAKALIDEQAQPMRARVGEAAAQALLYARRNDKT